MEGLSPFESLAKVPSGSMAFQYGFESGESICDPPILKRITPTRTLLPQVIDFKEGCSKYTKPERRI